MKKRIAYVLKIFLISLAVPAIVWAQTDTEPGGLQTIKKIDLHTHYIPDAYGHAIFQKFGEKPDGFPTPPWSVEEHLQFMDREGIDVSIVSASSPHISFGTDEETKALARQINEAGAKIVEQHPDRFGFLATLPLPNVEDSLEEIAYALDVLHADGFTLPTNARGVYLGDERLDPIFAELNRRHAVVALHPNQPSAIPANVAEGLPIPMMEFIFDTTRTVINLMLSGTLERNSDMTVIVPHVGAVLPVIIDRIAPVMKLFIKSANPDMDVYATFSRLYFDTAGICLPRQLPDLLEMVNSSHIFYGSDYPYTPEKICSLLSKQLSDTPALTDEQRQKIFHDNAVELFQRLKK